MKNKSVSLVLGSGGARGLTHIGVIKWLEEKGFEIKSISGSSMGALVGGIYSTGKLETFTNWALSLRKSDILQLMDFSLGKSGIIKGQKVIGEIKKLIGEYRIEDLNINFTAVATDLDTGREIWLNSGDLFDAIRASIAIPTIFTFHVINGMKLIDGGVINPVPIAPVLNDKNDFIIAVDLNANKSNELIIDKEDSNNNESWYRQKIVDFIENIPEGLGLKRDDESGLLDVLNKTIDIMQNVITRLKLAAYNPDYVIEIPRNLCTMYDFYKAKVLIDYGYKMADWELSSMLSKIN